MSKLLLCVSCAFRVAAVLLLFSALSGTALAEFEVAPEVDPGSMASALTLLAGGGLLLANRVRRMGKASKS